MPPPRKVDLLPSELRRWLQDELKERGFSGYEDVTEALNFRLEEEGFELRLGKSAVHAYGSEFKEYAKLQEESQDQMRAFLEEASLKDEVDVTSVLFQQLTAIQFKLQMAMVNPNSLPDPRGMKDLTTALNNLIRSTSLRDSLIAAERKVQSEKLDEAVGEGLIEEVAAQRAREIMGLTA